MVPVITWATPVAVTYGTPLSTTQLNAATTVPGSFVYTPVAGTVLPAGSQALAVTFTPTDTVTYATATAGVTLTVNKATPLLTWPTPAPVTVGATLSASQLNALSSVPGTFVYTPAAGTVLTSAGPQALSVIFTPTDSANYTTATAGVTLTVTAKLVPTLTWAIPVAITYGTPLTASQLNAATTVPGSFVYAPVAGTVLPAGSQALAVTFTPTDTVTYTTATAGVTLTVNKATPLLTWPTPAPVTVGATLSTSQLNALSSVPGTFVYTPAAGTVLTSTGPQALSVIFTPTDSANYTTATAGVTLTVNSTTRINIALQANGGIATASTTYSANYPVASLNNGDRKGLSWGAGGGWNDATNNVYPDWAQITFNGLKTIDEIDVFTVQDAFTTPLEPTATQTFTKYGISSFDVQYWNGIGWVTIPGGAITGNNLVWRKIAFPAVTTDQIRVQVNASLGGYSRIVEIEAYISNGSVVNTPPTVALTAPLTGATFTAPATISLTATASDPDGTVSKVEFYNGATLLGTALSAPYSYNWTNIAAGTYTLTARAYDNLGATTTSTAATVTVSPLNQPPTVALTAPLTGATFTAPATISLTATASDPDGTVSKVEFYNGATLLGTALSAPFSYNWTNIAAGTYTLTARAYDNLGATTTSTAATVTVNSSTRINVALQANGGIASASTTYNANYPVAAMNNGDRKGLSWGAGGGWNDATINVYPDWAQISFNGQKTIDEIDVFTVQDVFTSPLEPTATQTFTKYGITAFDVQYWNGTVWVTVTGGSIIGNNLVWRKITFPAVITDRVRVQVNSSMGGYSRITEIEVYGF